VKTFEIGEEITIGPTPVNKLIIRGEVTGKDEVQQSVLVSISEMISLPKKAIRNFMSAPLITLSPASSFREALHLFTGKHIHGAPVMKGGKLLGIVTLTDIAHGLDGDLPLDTPVSAVMTSDVVLAEADTRLYEVVTRFKEKEIGRLIVVEDGKPVGILTQSDVLGVFPSL
jgi:predicted transcriptional regulator